MGQEFFNTLPQELFINILSRLPLRAITACKCVCKTWLDLLATRDFGDSHLPNSVPALVFGPVESTYKIFDLDDALDLDRHDLHYNPLEFRFPLEPVQIICSANGLLLLQLLRAQTANSVARIFLFVCNPITRDCIQLRGYSYSLITELRIYGLGASRITGTFKVVRILHYQEFSTSVCFVYTLGTGSWRFIQPDATIKYCQSCGEAGAFLNGNLHWMVYDRMGSLQISCFDIETECFSTFDAPISHRQWGKSLCALEDCLCLCDNSAVDEIVIWSMKEYGDEKSWTREFVIAKNPGIIRGQLQSDTFCSNEVVRPFKVFKDGDVLMAWGDFFLLYYSNKTKTTQKINMFEPPSTDIRTKAVLHTPSFVSLKFFTMENVSSFDTTTMPSEQPTMETVAIGRPRRKIKKPLRYC